MRRGIAGGRGVPDDLTIRVHRGGSADGAAEGAEINDPT